MMVKMIVKTNKEVLADIRNRYAIPVNQIVDSTGLSRSTVSRALNGEASYRTIQKLAKFFAVDPEILVEEEE